MEALNSLLYSFVKLEANKGKLGDGFTWGETLSVTACGLIVVFSMLIILVLSIFIFSKIMSAVNKPKKQEVLSEVKPMAVVEQPKIQNNVSEEDELIAVISAAVYSMYDGTGKTPVIKSVSRADNNARSAWSNAGLLQNTRAF